MAISRNDLHELRSILRTPPATFSGRDEKPVDWTTPKALPYNSVFTPTVFISRRRDFFETYAAEEYDRSSIEFDLEANKALSLHKSLSMHQREEGEDEASVNDTGVSQDFRFAAERVNFAPDHALYNGNVRGVPPRPHTPHPALIATALPSPVSDKLEAPTEEEQRAEAFARFHAGSNSPAASALLAMASAVKDSASDSEDDGEMARMHAFAQFRALKNKNENTTTLPSVHAAPCTDIVESTVGHNENVAPATQIASPARKRYPGGLSARAGIVRPKARRAVAGNHHISFSSGGFSDIGADEGTLGGF